MRAIEYNDLIDKYVKDFDLLSYSELLELKRYIETDTGSEVRESRLLNINKKIKVLDKLHRVGEKERLQHDVYVKCSRDLKAITDNWESNGVDKVSSEWRNTWQVDGVIIFEIRGALTGLGKPVCEYLRDAEEVDREYGGY